MNLKRGRAYPSYLARNTAPLPGGFLVNINVNRWLGGNPHLAQCPRHVHIFVKMPVG